MTKGKTNTDEFFHDVAVNYTESPPHYSWKNLADSLSEKKKKRRIVYFRLAAAVIAIMLAFSIGYFYSGLNTNEEQQIVRSENQIITEHENKTVENPSNQGNIAEIQTSEIANSEIADSKINEKQIKIKSSKKTTITDRKPLFANSSNKVEANINKNNIVNVQIAQKPDIENIVIFDSTVNKQAEELKEKFAIKEEGKPKPDSLRLDYIPEIINLPELSNPVAQNKAVKESRWSVGGELAPTYTYRSTNSILKSDETNTATLGGQSQDKPINTINEAPVITYSGGFNTRYKLSKRWMFQSGLYYSKFGQSAEYFNVVTEPDQSLATNTAAGNVELNYTITSNNFLPTYTVFGGNPTYSDFYQYFEYLEIPLAFRYKVVDRKIDLNLLSGIYTGFLVGNNAYTISDGKKEIIGKTQGINSMIYSAMLGFGIEYELYKKVTVSLEPLFKYSLNSINNDSEYIYKPYSIGVFTGVNYRL